MSNKMRTRAAVTAGLCAALTLTGTSVAVAEDVVAPNTQEQTSADAAAEPTEVNAIDEIVSRANSASGALNLVYKGEKSVVPTNLGATANSAAFVFVNANANADVTIDFDGATIDASSCVFTNKASILGIHGFKGELTIKNLVIVGAASANGTNVKHCLNVFNSANVVLENVELKNSATAGMVVNGSKVTASGLKASGNAWGSVNVDQTTSVPDGASTSFSMVGQNALEDAVQIWTEKPSQCTIAADGYTKVVGGKEGDGTLKGYTYYTDDVASLGAFVIESAGGTRVYKTLEPAVADAQDGQVIKLVADANCGTEQTNLTDKALTLDLCGHKVTTEVSKHFVTINGENAKLVIEDSGDTGEIIATKADPVILVAQGTLDFQDGTLRASGTWTYNGDLYGADGIRVLGSSDSTATNYSNIIVGKDAVIANKDDENIGAGYAINVNRTDELGNHAFGVAVDFQGATVNSGMYVNGQIVDVEGSVPTLSLKSGAVVDGMIYAAGYAKWDIDGAAITDSTGMEIRAGVLNMTSGSITGTGTPTEVKPNGNGSTTDGAGLAVSQHTTGLPIELNITGGMISGYTGFYESNPQKNSQEMIQKIKLSISGGTILAANGGANSIYSGDHTGFVSGGTFGSKVDDSYLADTVKAELQIGKSFSYFDSVEKALVEADKTGGTVSQIGAEATVEVTLDYGFDSKKVVLNTAPGTVLPTPTRSGYTFLGWYNGDSKVEKVPEAEMSLAARWSSNTPSGGGGSTSDKTDVEQNQDGSTTTTVTKPDGSQTITHETASGTESVVKKDKDGNVTSTEVSVSKQDAESGKVELPIGKSEPAADASKAPEVEVKVPSTVTAEKPVQVTVPVAKAEGAEPNYGVVVFAIDEDGNETLIPKTAVDDDGNVVFEATGDVTIKVVDAAKDMPDVTEADWFAGDVVDFATARGIVNGVDTPSGKQFQGYGKTSRGMLVAMLHNLELNPEAASAESLPDVPEGAFYADAAAWALEEGILSGVDMPDGTKQFQGNTDVTREQVAVFLMRYAQSLGMDTSKRAEIDFPDAGEVSAFAKDAMSWAVAEGLFKGDDATGELNPTDGAARAEVAAVLMRFINLMYA